MRDYWDQNVGRESCLSRCANFVQGSYFLRSCFQIRQNIDLCRKFAQRSNMAMSGGPQKRMDISYSNISVAHQKHSQATAYNPPFSSISNNCLICRSCSHETWRFWMDFPMDFPCWEHFRHFRRPFEELKEKLWALAERRPAEATKLMGQAFAGKKSLGEMASAPQTSDPNLKLVDSLSHCFSHCLSLL